MLKHWQLSLWVERCVNGHKKRKFHNQRSKTLKILEQHVALKKKKPQNKKEVKSVSNIYLLSFMTCPHAWKRYYTIELIDSDWLKVGLLLFWESYEKARCTLGQSVLVCSRGNDTWIFFCFIFQFWNCLVLKLTFWTLPTELFDLIWDRAFWSSALLRREMLTKEQVWLSVFMPVVHWTIWTYIFNMSGEFLSHHVMRQSDCC